MRRSLFISFIASLLIVGCNSSSSSTVETQSSSSFATSSVASSFSSTMSISSASSSSSASTSSTSSVAPLYFYLFVHTEDHINHDYSERRYRELLPEVKKWAQKYPDEHLVWTIEFHGAEAKTVNDRNADGLADMLREYAKDGYIEFGYHAQHEPTYMNRPMNDIKITDSFETKLAAMQEWVSCEKDPLYGGSILLDSGECKSGGIRAIADNFGEPQVVSGLFLYDETSLGESDIGVYAVKKYVPSRKLGFGFTDHGGTSKGSDYTDNLHELFGYLTPDKYTSGSLFWSDNILRINAGDLLDDIQSISMLDSQEDVELNLEACSNRDRPRVINAHVGTKYIYTRSDLGTSPTKYAYANPESPELPDDYRYSDEEIEQHYTDSKVALQRVVEYAHTSENTQFINSKGVLDLVMTDDFMHIDAQELNALAQEYIDKVDANKRVPNILYDGDKHYYALRDLFSLLMRESLSKGATLDLVDTYGPFSLDNTVEDNGGFQPKPKAVDTINVSAVDITAQITANASKFIPSESWAATTPSNTVASKYGTLDAAQMLYAMAKLYVDPSVKDVTIPKINPLPQTFDTLQKLNYEDATETSWSLRPAVIRY